MSALPTGSGVQSAEARIAIVHGSARIVQDAHARRIFEQNRAIVATQVARVAAEPRHAHERILRVDAVHRGRGRDHTSEDAEHHPNHRR